MTLLESLFRYDALDRIFSDSESVQSMLLFEAGLARAEATAAIIPESASRAIAAQCRAENFDLAALQKSAALSGNIAIPLIKMLAELVAKQDDEAARYIHWGGTSQDVTDTATILQLRRAFELLDQDLHQLTTTLAALAEAHRSTPMAARTWMQQALPTTFGFIAAGWLDALLRHRQRLAEIRPRVLTLQFGGAVGTLAALGEKGPQVAKLLADDLFLTLPLLPWHSHRDRIAEVATTLGLLIGTLGKIARDISLHSQTEIAELFEPSAPGRGGSSTMPQKRNPVTCAVVLSASYRVPGLVSTLLSSMAHEYQRGLGGWHAEWETLPELICLTGGALHHLAEMLPHLEVDSARMLKNLNVTNGLIFAEAVTMALAPTLGKPAAHEIVEACASKALAESRPFKDVLRDEPRLQGKLSSADFDRLFDLRYYLGSSDDFINGVLAAAQESPTTSQ
jgi:3-carboxy-cis,cis-muconate cycloisomerase